MNHYIDIVIQPDAEMRLNVLLNAVYTKLHKALCDLASVDIGVSFPKYATTLGDVVRVHGDQAALNDLQGLAWLGGISGYCNISGILPVPGGVKYRVISRKQSTMSQSKAKRLILRGSITESELKGYRAAMFNKGLDNAYVEVISSSNGHKYRRYFEFGPVIDTPIAGSFDQFGLSKSATVPWF